MTYQCELLERPAQPAVTIRTRTDIGGLPDVMGKSFGAIAHHIGKIEEQPTGPAFAAYYNMDMQDLDVEIGFPVSKEVQGSDEIQASEIPGGKYAACLYIGPYKDMEPAYTALTTWIEAQGYQATGVVYEVYLNDPSEIPPENLQTQILFLLEGDS